jgi:hypothetical protein
MSNTFFEKQLKSFLGIEEDTIGTGDIGGADLTTDARPAASPLEGGTKGYHVKKKKKKIARTPLLVRGFLDHMLEAKEISDALEFGSSFPESALKEKLNKEFYRVGDQKYTIPFFRRSGQSGFGKMYFVGGDGFALRFNRLKQNKEDKGIDSISFWNKWRTTVIEEDLNFGQTPDADVITEGMPIESVFQIAEDIFKNRNPKTLILKNLSIKKNGKPANNEFEKELADAEKTSISYMELLDFAKEKGYNISDAEDESLKINVQVPMKIPNEEYIVPHKTEYAKDNSDDDLVKNGKLMLTAVNIQAFTKNSTYAEELLQFFDSLFKDKLINNLSFESVLFASKIRETNHPNWINLLTPKM